jgi:PAS domain S-box-containing protein
LFLQQQVFILMADTSTAPEPIDLQLFFHAMPDPVIILDPGFNIWQVNDAFLALTAARRSELVGQPFLSVFPHQAAAPDLALQQSLQSAGDTGQVCTLATQKYELPAPDGAGPARYWDWVITPVAAEAGKLAGFLLQVTDVTARQQDRSHEPRNRELLQAIHQNLNDVVWDWDLATNHIWWSQGLHTSFGYTDRETEPTISCWYSRIHPEDGARVIDGIYQVIDSDLTLWSDVYRFKKKNGEYAEVLTRGSVFRDPAGKGYRMIGTMVDITLHQKAEAGWAAGDLALVS